MAKKKAPEPTTAELWQSFTVDILAIFTRYNGKLWRVRRAGEIAAAVNVIVNSIAIFGFQRQP